MCDQSFLLDYILTSHLLKVPMGCWWYSLRNLHWKKTDVIINIIKHKVLKPVVHEVSVFVVTWLFRKLSSSKNNSLVYILITNIVFISALFHFSSSWTFWDLLLNGLHFWNLIILDFLETFKGNFHTISPHFKSYTVFLFQWKAPINCKFSVTKTTMKKLNFNNLNLIITFQKFFKVHWIISIRSWLWRKENDQIPFIKIDYIYTDILHLFTSCYTCIHVPESLRDLAANFFIMLEAYHLTFTTNFNIH